MKLNNIQNNQLEDRLIDKMSNNYPSKSKIKTLSYRIFKIISLKNKRFNSLIICWL